MTTTTNIFDKGCLVIVSISAWSGSKKINKRKVEEMMKTKQARANKELLPDEALEQIDKLKGKINNWLNSICLPFPVRGAKFCSFESVETIDKQLQTFESEYIPLIDNFVSNYETYKDMVRESLTNADLYDERDYPADIRTKFGIIWKFIMMTAPNENSLLSPEFMRREKEKFISTLQEAEQMGIEALRLEFTKLIDNAVDRLTPTADGKKKIFKEATITNFTEFFETFTMRNCFNDETLSGLVEKAKSVLNGVDTKSLKADDTFKAQIALKLSSVQEEVNKGIGTLPGRKLNLD